MSVLEHLRKTKLDQNCIMDAFDVISLYTKVQNGAALQEVSEMLKFHVSTIEVYRLNVVRTIGLIKECLYGFQLVRTVFPSNPRASYV